jgi:ATP-binding cassette subfamily B protein
MARLFELAGMHKGLVIFSGILAVLSSVASFIPYLAIYFLIRGIIAVFPNFAYLDMARVMNYGLLALFGVFGKCATLFCLPYPLAYRGIRNLVRT